MAYEKYLANEIAGLEDRLRTITERLRKMREIASNSLGGVAELQLGSFQPYLKRLDKLTANALAKCELDAQQKRVAESLEEYRRAKSK